MMHAYVAPVTVAAAPILAAAVAPIPDVAAEMGVAGIGGGLLIAVVRLVSALTTHFAKIDEHRSLEKAQWALQEAHREAQRAQWRRAEISCRLVR